MTFRIFIELGSVEVSFGRLNMLVGEPFGLWTRYTHDDGSSEQTWITPFQGFHPKKSRGKTFVNPR